MRIVAGTYEGYLFGWESTRTVSEPGEDPGLSLTFAFEAHDECIRAIAMVKETGGNFLVTGGNDETIRIYNLQKRVEVGSLMQHAAAIMALDFYQDLNLLSGSKDGTICIWRTSDWQCLHILGGHKDAVNSIAVHPSGKLALSVSKDRTLRMWNLVKGRSAFIKRLEKEATLVRWSPKGESYATVIDKTVYQYNAAGDLTATLAHSARINGIAFLSEKTLAAAGEDRKIYVYDKEGRLSKTIDTKGGSRIKDLHTVEEEGKHFIVSGTSTGLIQVWDPAGSEDSGPCGSVQLTEGLRLTALCCGASKPQEQEKGDRKEEKEQSTEEQRDEEEDDEPEEKEDLSKLKRKQKAVVTVEGDGKDTAQQKKKRRKKGGKRHNPKYRQGGK